MEHVDVSPAEAPAAPTQYGHSGDSRPRQLGLTDETVLDDFLFLRLRLRRSAALPHEVT